MTIDIERMRAEMRRGARRFAASAITVAATAFAVGAALGHRFARPPLPQTIILQLQPCTPPAAT